MLKNLNKKKKGFTLIELVIVLAVLAIIALIAIPNFTKVREDSQVKSDNRSLESIVKVIDMAIIDENILDTSTGTIKVDFDATTNKVTKASLTIGAGITVKSEADIVEALNKVNPPQAKEKGAYQIDLINGAVDLKSLTTVQ